MKRGTFLLAFTFFVSTFSFAVKAKLPDNLSRLKSEQENAIELSLSYPDQAKIAHIKIAKKLEALLANHSNHNRQIIAYNIATSWYHADQLGKSLLWYKRAQKENSSFTLLNKNIDAIQAMRIDDLPVNFDYKPIAYISKFTHSMALIIASAAGYIFAIWVLWMKIRKQSVTKKTYKLSFIVLFLVVISWVFRLSYTLQSANGVITASTTVSRKGPSELYQPALKKSLHAGTEFILLETARNWSRIQLSNGLHLWVENKDIEII